MTTVDSMLFQYVLCSRWEREQTVVCYIHFHPWKVRQTKSCKLRSELVTTEKRWDCESQLQSEHKFWLLSSISCYKLERERVCSLFQSETLILCVNFMFRLFRCRFNELWFINNVKCYDIIVFLDLRGLYNSLYGSTTANVCNFTFDISNEYILFLKTP